MAEYFSTSQRTYVAASGSVAIDNDGMEVLKVKPSGVDHDDAYGYSFGNPLPTVIARGRQTPETLTCSVRLAQWKAWLAAHPDYRLQMVQVFVTYEEPALGSVTYNHQNCSIKSWKPTESDGGATSEATVDLEIMALGIQVGGIQA